MIQEQSWIIKYASEPAGLATDPRIQIKSDKSKLVKWAVLPALGYHLYLWEEKRGGGRFAAEFKQNIINEELSLRHKLWFANLKMS